MSRPWNRELSWSLPIAFLARFLCHWYSHSRGTVARAPPPPEAYSFTQNSVRKAPKQFIFTPKSSVWIVGAFGGWTSPTVFSTLLTHCQLCTGGSAIYCIHRIYVTILVGLQPLRSLTLQLIFPNSNTAKFGKFSGRGHNFETLRGPCSLHHLTACFYSTGLNLWVCLHKFSRQLCWTEFSKCQ